MSRTDRIVISASRRTDIPAFYMPWFMQRLAEKQVETVNPYNQRKKTVPLSPAYVHTIVFWSKNFGPFIDGGFGKKIRGSGYALFFNFTVNTPSRRLEPGVPPLADRLDQLAHLCATYGAGAVTWRFDPICFFKTRAGTENNLGAFNHIADAAARNGIRRCITSFRDDYQKTRRRTARLTNFRFADPPAREKTRILMRMASQLAGRGISLYTCCEKEILASLPPDSGVRPAACIDHDLLTRLYGDGLSGKPDAGQRRQQGCGCHHSVDIGGYRQHPCYHNCLFCYANPTPRT